MSKQENTKASGWDFRRLEENLGYAFQNPKLLKTALTHSSYANEAHNGTRSNERLEFLGDAVLSIVVSDYIFRNCPHLPEGELTKMRASLVCEKSLQRFSRVLEIGSFLRLSRGEQNSGGAERSSILADAFEAVLAAIYLDGGMERPGSSSCALPSRKWKIPSPRPLRIIKRLCRRSSSKIRRKSLTMCWWGKAVRIIISILLLRFI